MSSTSSSSSSAPNYSVVSLYCPLHGSYTRAIATANTTQMTRTAPQTQSPKQTCEYNQCCYCRHCRILWHVLTTNITCESEVGGRTTIIIFAGFVAGWLGELAAFPLFTVSFGSMLCCCCWLLLCAAAAGAAAYCCSRGWSAAAASVLFSCHILLRCLSLSLTQRRTTPTHSHTI